MATVPLSRPVIASEFLMESSISSKRPPWFNDPLWPIFVAIGVAVFVWTLRHYPRPTPPPPFPRHASEFRSPPALAAAKAAALAVLAVRPDDMNAHVEMVLACFEGGSGDYVKGLEYLERARDLGALDDRLFYYAAVMYENQGLLEYAVPEYEKFLRRHPNDLETRLRLGNLFYRMEELDKSIDAYHLVLAGQPNDPLVSYNLAMAYRDKKKWAEGLDSLKPFLASGKPLPVGGHKLLGDLYRGNGDAQRALSEYDLERANSGESVDVASGMAQAAESLGQMDVAIERWKKVLELDPAHREARNRLRKLKQPVPGRRR